MQFALTQLENLHHLLKSRDNFWLNATWYRWSVAALIFYRRYNQAAHSVYSWTVLAFLPTLVRIVKLHHLQPPKWNNSKDNQYRH